MVWHGFRANRILAPRRIAIGRTAGRSLRPTNPKRLIPENHSIEKIACRSDLFCCRPARSDSCRIRRRAMRPSAADATDNIDTTDAARDLPRFACRCLRTVNADGKSGYFGPKNIKTMPETPHGVSGIVNRSDDRYLLSSATDFCAAATLSPAVTFLSAAMACGFISLAL